MHGNEIPPIIRLKFKKNDLIIKEGDYGVSIYEVLHGKVDIYTEVEDIITKLATLETGQLFGEMAFLSGGTEPRAASARAIEDTVVEVWHPNKLKKEYSEMPTILRLMIGQTLKRLIRINKIIAEFHAKKIEKERTANQEKPGSKRFYFRKHIEIPCVYRTSRSPETSKFQGIIRDISKGGARLEISSSNFTSVSHLPGDNLIINVMIPPDKELNVTAEIVNIRRSDESNLTLGLSFRRLSEDEQKKLGFFLMPYGKAKLEQRKPEVVWP